MQCSTAVEQDASTLQATSTRNTHNVFHNENATEDKKFLVLFITSLGLANRLRAIADWYIISRASNRHLILSWQPTLECNAEFADLFDVAAVHHILAFTALKDPITFDDAVAMAQTLQMSHTTILDLPNFFVVRNSPLFDADFAVVLTTYHGELAVDDLPCEKYLSERRSFLSALQPVKQIAAFTTHLKNEYFSSSANRVMIGVHFRTHVPEYDWAVVPPFYGAGNGHAPAVRFAEGASLEEFQMVMAALLVHRPSARFLFTSNDAAAKTHMRDVFGDKVVVLEGSLSRSTVKGVQFALLEWIALSQSDLILHTHGSSFAQLASQRSGSALLSMWHKHLLFTTSAKLLHCGLLHYMNRASKDGAQQAYVEEGTLGDRVINSGYVRISHCSMFQSDWGLEGVYCSEPAR